MLRAIAVWAGGAGRSDVELRGGTIHRNFIYISASIESAGVRKGSNWASERAARVDSGVLMGQDQGADGAGSGEELYQEQLRAQGAGSSRATRQRKLQQAAQVKS